MYRSIRIINYLDVNVNSIIKKIVAENETDILVLTVKCIYIYK